MVIDERGERGEIGRNRVEEEKMDDGMAPMRPEGGGNFTVPVRIGTGYYDEVGKHGVYTGLAEDKGYNQDRNRVQKTSFSHESMIDLIIANPRITQVELAAEYGYTAGWVSRILGSDSFQAALAKRKSEIVDPFLVATTEERLKGLAFQSMDIIADKLEATKSADLALKTLDTSIKALGFGARDRSPANVQNFVVQLPGKANSTEDWAQAAAAGAYRVLEQVPAVVEPAQELENFSTTVTIDPTIQPTPMKTAGDE